MQKITNRIEYNEDTIRIFSGVTSLTCKLNEITKNLLRIDGINQDFSIYTKMNEMYTIMQISKKIDDQNREIALLEKENNNQLHKLSIEEDED